MHVIRHLHLNLLVFGSIAALGSCQGNPVSPDDMMTDAGSDAGDPSVDSGPGSMPGTDSGPGTPPPPPPPPGTAVNSGNVLFVGHSLINWDMPKMMAALATDADRDHSWDAQIGLGGSIQLQWERSAAGVNARDALATGNYDVLVMTEAIPLESHYQWSGSVEYAGNFYALAQQHRPGTRVFMYETWHETDEPNWRGRIDTDRALWERIIDEVNAANEGPDMEMIPAGTALGQLVDRIAAGGVPGLTSRDQLFDDNIHMTDLGNYFVACVQFATIYRMSPVGLTARTVNEFDTPYDTPSPEAARLMQEVAWEVVSADARAGVR